MLGTGCSVPNKIRNTSSILLRVNKDSSILLDCGEGTLGQIIRYYGVSEGLNILRTIKVCHISKLIKLIKLFLTLELLIFIF